MERTLSIFVDPNGFDYDNGVATTYSASGMPQQQQTTVTTTTQAAPNGAVTGTPATATSKKTVRPSMHSRSSYINYRGQGGHNDFNPHVLSSEEMALVDYNRLIAWSQQYEGIKLRAQDFAYLRHIGVYPINRLMVLRRFPGASADDLFDWKGGRAINTVVGFIDPDDETALDLSFNEVWEPNVTKGLVDVINEIIGISNPSSKLPTFDDSSNLQQSITVAIGRALGIVNENRNPLGEADIIHEAAIRKTNYEGLHSQINFVVTAEYEYKYFPGIDGHLAMLDNISNLIAMGTSDAKFVMNGEFSGKVATIVQRLKNGEMDLLAKELIVWLKAGLSKLIGRIEGFLSKTAADTKAKYLANNAPAAADGTGGQGKAEAAANAVKDESVEIGAKAISSFIDTINDLISTTIYKYAWPLRGAIGAMSGGYTAPWHITMGNPKAPWFSIGNLIMKNVELEVGNKLAFDDTPNSVKVKYHLTPGRNLGAQELASKFNLGKGRIYMPVEAEKAVVKPAAAPAASTKVVDPAKAAKPKAKPANSPAKKSRANRRP